MKIEIKAKSGPTNAKDLSILNGIECNIDFVEYIRNKELRNKLIDGYMSFILENKTLYTLTTYRLKEGNLLSPKEIRELVDYTQGQWSDGIGESYEQMPIAVENNKEIYLSPYLSGEKPYAKFKS